MENWTDNWEVDDGELVTRYFSKIFGSNIPMRLMGTVDKAQSNQVENITHIIQREAIWIEAALNALLTYYQEAYPYYRLGWEMGGADEATIEQALPKHINREKLLQLMVPTEIYISPEATCKVGTFGLGLECEWDEEHGLGVYFDEWAVYETGGMDVAFGH